MMFFRALSKKSPKLVAEITSLSDCAGIYPTVIMFNRRSVNLLMWIGCVNEPHVGLWERGVRSQFGQKGTGPRGVSCNITGYGRNEKGVSISGGLKSEVTNHDRSNPRFSKGGTQ